MTRVCILVHNNVATDARVIKQADALCAAGYEVTVLGVRNPNSGGRLEWLEGRPWRLVLFNRDKRTQGGRFNWLRTAVRSHAAEVVARHLTLDLGMAENSLIRGYGDLVRLAAAQRADVYHANDLNTLPVACQAALPTAARVVYDAHELYTEEEGGMAPHRRRLLEHVERRYIHRASTVITVSPGIGRILAQMYGIAAPVTIYNVPPLSQMPPAREEPALGDGGPERSLSVIYHGHIDFGTRGLEDLLGAISSLAAGVEVHFRGFMSDAVKGEIRRIAERTGKPLRIHPPVSPAQLLQHAARHDVGLVLTQPTCRNNEHSAPNKLFQYFLAGLAVVCTDVAGFREILTGVDAALTYTPGDTAGLAAALNRLAADREALRRLQRNARSAALSRFNWDLEQGKLLGIYKGLVA